MTILLTGCAGFIGMHAASALLARGEEVVGVDDLNPYYNVQLKTARLARLTAQPGFTFHRADIADPDAMRHLANRHPQTDRILHLAAQPGVRHSLVDPFIYVTANVMGHLVILETARHLKHVRHLVYASSSSVYGANRTMPFLETDDVSRPLSLYAATKRAGELMSETYRHLFALPQTGLRFFTVYGPWGRPDMAVYEFASRIATGRPITLYEGDGLTRDFTYIDDIVAGILGCLDRPPPLDKPARLLNLGDERPEKVTNLIALLERGLGRSAIVEAIPRPATDVEATFASIDAIRSLIGYQPRVTLAEGIPRFLEWFRGYERLESPASSAISA